MCYDSCYQVTPKPFSTFFSRYNIQTFFGSQGTSPSHPLWHNSARHEDTPLGLSRRLPRILQTTTTSPGPLKSFSGVEVHRTPARPSVILDSGRSRRPEHQAHPDVPGSQLTHLGSIPRLSPSSPLCSYYPLSADLLSFLFIFLGVSSLIVFI